MYSEDECAPDSLLQGLRMISVQKGLQVGDTLNMKGSAFEIIGIYETGVSFEDAGGVILLSEAQSLFGLGNQVSMLRVKLKDVNTVDTVRTTAISVIYVMWE